MSRRDELPLPLARLLEAPWAIKTGVGITNDARKISKELGVQVSPLFDSAITLRKRLQAGGGSARHTLGLRQLAIQLLGISEAESRAWKRKKLTMSNWAAPKLKENQIRYATLDAWVSAAAAAVLGIGSRDLINEGPSMAPEGTAKAKMGDQRATPHSRRKPPAAPAGSPPMATPAHLARRSTHGAKVTARRPQAMQESRKSIPADASSSARASGTSTTRGRTQGANAPWRRKATVTSRATSSVPETGTAHKDAGRSGTG